MPRARSPARDKAKELWLESNKKRPLIDIAKELGVSDTQIRKWKNADNWEVKDNKTKSNELKGSLPKGKGNVTNHEDVDKPKKRSGNPDPVKKFTKRNQVARKHGLYAKYLNPDQLEIIDDFEDVEIAEQLYIQIKLKFSAIMQLQKVMWVSTADDHLQVETGRSEGVVSNTSYKVAFAYERYESYIKAQTRAMAEYRNLVKHFLALIDEDDERRLKLDSMRVELDRKREEVKQLKGVDSGTTTIIVNNEDEMRKRMKEREQKKHDGG